MNRERLLRAMRAAQAVTLGGAAFVGACGTTPAGPDVDTGVDALADADDAAGDVALDASADGSGTPCLDESDGVCPEGCTNDQDRDCCEAEPSGLCDYSPGFGCSCAIEGPFAPPSLPTRRAAA